MGTTATVTTKLFKSHTTQAVRLPKAVAFPEGVSEVEVVVDGEARVIRPVRPKTTWEEFFKLVTESADPDFLPDRMEGLTELREPPTW